jgi:hypothetical protein
MPIKNILVNSKNRLNGTPSRFQYQLLHPIMNPTAIALESAQMWNVQYTIDTRNNTLHWKDGAGQTHTTVLTSGYYTSTSLATYLQSTLNSAKHGTDANTYTVTHSSATGKMTISSSGGNFELLFGTGTTNSIASTIGFSDTNRTGTYQYTSDKLVNLNTKYFTIETDMIDNVTHEANAALPSFIVPNNVNWGDLITYIPTLAKSFTTNQREISNIEFTVKDDRGNIVDFNEQDWSAVFVVNSD